MHCGLRDDIHNQVGPPKTLKIPRQVEMAQMGNPGAAILGNKDAGDPRQSADIPLVREPRVGPDDGRYEKLRQGQGFDSGI